ncbi:MAG: hypothetical protein GY847_00875 [Proteobacteria bacterium]|nr:hypothetical protein [Pseudomonadota bacterium]
MNRLPYGFVAMLLMAGCYKTTALSKDEAEDQDTGSDVYSDADSDGDTDDDSDRKTDTETETDSLSPGKHEDMELIAIWGSSGTDIYAVGTSGFVVHYNGEAWTENPLDIEGDLLAIWGDSASDVFVVGTRGIVFHFDGSSWSQMESNTEVTLRAIWGDSATSVFAVGDEGTIVHFDGLQWNRMESGVTHVLLDIWGSSATDVYTVGGVDRDGSILHHDGEDWMEIVLDLKSDFPSTNIAVYCILGFSRERIYITAHSAGFAFDGCEGFRVAEFDGLEWNEIYENGCLWTRPSVIWGSSKDDLYLLAPGDNRHIRFRKDEWFEWSEYDLFGVSSTRFMGVWGTSKDNIYTTGYKLVGDSDDKHRHPRIWHTDGEEWRVDYYD